MFLFNRQVLMDRNENCKSWQFNTAMNAPVGSSTQP